MTQRHAAKSLIRATTPLLEGMVLFFGSPTPSFRDSPVDVLNNDIAAQRDAFVVASDVRVARIDAVVVQARECRICERRWRSSERR